MGVAANPQPVSHASTIERLYAWQKNLFLDVQMRSSATRFILQYLPASVLTHGNVRYLEQSDSLRCREHTNSSECTAWLDRSQAVSVFLLLRSSLLLLYAAGRLVIIILCCDGIYPQGFRGVAIGYVWFKTTWGCVLWTLLQLIYSLIKLVLKLFNPFTIVKIGCLRVSDLLQWVLRDVSWRNTIVFQRILKLNVSLRWSENLTLCCSNSVQWCPSMNPTL